MPRKAATTRCEIRKNAEIGQRKRDQVKEDRWDIPITESQESGRFGALIASPPDRRQALVISGKAVLAPYPAIRRLRLW